VLNNNHFTGTLPAIAVPPGPLSLSVRNNFLTGTIPANYSGNMNSIDCSGNQLTGTLPLLYSGGGGNWNFSRNSLSGTLPSVIDLSWVDFSYNLLSGTIPSYANPQWDIAYFILNNNMFTGTLPDMPNIYMVEMDFSNNFLTGTIPKQWSGMDPYNYLSIVNLKGNHFSSNNCFPKYWNTSVFQYCGMSDMRFNCSCNAPSICNPLPCSNTKSNQNLKKKLLRVQKSV